MGTHVHASVYICSIIYRAVHSVVTLVGLIVHIRHMRRAMLMVEQRRPVQCDAAVSTRNLSNIKFREARSK